MSTYLYGCLACGHKEEKKHGMKESPEYKCPVCGEPLKKCLSSGHTGFTAQYWEGNTREFYGY